MHNIYNLICKEIEELDKKAGMGDISPAEYEKMSDLIETKKNMLKIGEMEDMGSSSYARGENRGGSYNSYNMGGSYDGSYNNMSYARGDGRGRGSQANRDSRGRYSSERGYSGERGYSRDNDLMEEIEMLPEHKKNEIRRMIKEM